MAYEIAVWSNNIRKVLKVVDTVSEAKTLINTMFTDVFIEEDSENPDHFDVFAYEGDMSEVFVIEPVKG